jgi:hypothetical protein
VLEIRRDDEWFVEKDFFGLPKRDAMDLPVFLEVPIVPVKTCATFKNLLRLHTVSISQAYTEFRPSGGLTA